MLSNYSIRDFHTLIFDFDGVFTDNKVYITEDGYESAACSRYDGFAFDVMRALQKKGLFRLDVMILSKEPKPIVLKRAEKLKINCAHGIDHKLEYLTNYFKEKNHKNGFDGLVYLGNDLNDLAVMRRAKLAVAPCDAHPIIKKIAHVVLPQDGGQGFVRAFMDEFLGINKLSLDELEELLA